ncbi:MAG: hydroxyacid dehydrogenase [Proteobacteria bacterium]|jgi:D-3-phosphoglycerate dehydrogenase|nr:hydroxyacid dehydrogenase [Pseudomonadota bacterium]
MKKKQVARFDVWYDPVMEERFAQEADIDLITLKREGDDKAALQSLSSAQVYMITAAKDELAKRWWAGESLLAQCPQLLCVSSSGAGFDTVDVEACNRAGIAVVNQSGCNARSVAEHALGLMLGLSHRIGEGDRMLRSADRSFSREDLMGLELGGKTLGLVGIGMVGREVAKLAQAFEMRVIAYDPLLDPLRIRERGAEAVSLEALLAQSDIVSLHCPRDASSLGMFNAARFKAMKTGAWFISTARGGIHDEAALYQALVDGKLAGAGLDVWDQEPPPSDHPLVQHPKVISSFHTAGVTRQARYRAARWGAEQVIGFLAGAKPPRLVNPEVWPRVAARLAQTIQTQGWTNKSI